MIDDVIHIDMTVTDSDDVAMDASDAVPVSTSDYDKLKNRPLLYKITRNKFKINRKYYGKTVDITVKP